MIDIVWFPTDDDTNKDLRIFNSQAPRAANILSVQIGSLEYEPTLGIDMDYFLSNDFRVQNESFKHYLVQRLATYGINVATLTELIENLITNYKFDLVPSETSTSLVAR